MIAFTPFLFPHGALPSRPSCSPLAPPPAPARKGAFAQSVLWYRRPPLPSSLTPPRGEAAARSSAPLWLADAFPRWLRLSRRVVAPSLSNPFWARTRAASPRLNAMQLAAALGTSLYKKEAQNDHSIVEASSEDLAQIEIVLSLGESRPCPRECDPACPACPISGCLRSCPP